MCVWEGGNNSPGGFQQNAERRVGRTCIDRSICICATACSFFFLLTTFTLSNKFIKLPRDVYITLPLQWHYFLFITITNFLNYIKIVYIHRVFNNFIYILINLFLCIKKIFSICKSIAAGIGLKIFFFRRLLRQ